MSQMSTTSTDTALINQVLAGDSAAYAQLVERYQRYVFTLCLRMIPAREDAEEVAQDVFIKAFRSLADFRGDARFSTWLYTIVHTSCLSFLRKKKLHHQSIDAPQAMEIPEGHSADWHAAPIEKKSRAALLRQAMTLLSHDDAHILTLFYQAEQSLDEIAGILSIEVNTAKVRLHRARTRLKEKMEQHFAAEMKEIR